jgi:cytochrome c-type biogenesis protein CcmH
MAKRGVTLLLAGVLPVFLAFAMGAARANDAAPAVANPALEARMVTIASELRCLVCQNQTIADSNAELAVDLRGQVREMLQAGKTDQEITDYMTARYGDFVLYRPPFKATTALLWFGPAAMVLIGLGSLFVVLRRRSRMAADQFEPEEPSAVPDHPKP